MLIDFLLQVLIGFDEGEGVNYMSKIVKPTVDKSGWEEAVRKLIVANYRTEEARNYIKKFIQFEYRNWTAAKSGDEVISSSYRSYVLQVTKARKFLCQLSSAVF